MTPKTQKSLLTQVVLLGLGVLGVWTQTPPLAAADREQLWSAAEAQRHGLVRAWFGQVQMDPARSRVQDLCLYEDIFLVQTDRAILHAFEAETGRTQWAVLVGSATRPSLQPAINSQLVAIVNGSTLFLLNRIDGKILWKTQLDGFPGAGPTLANDRVYVPMLEGLIYSYHLQPAKDPREALGELRASSRKKQKESPEERRTRMAELRLSQEKVRPVVCQSLGHTMTPLQVGFEDAREQLVVWPSHLGYLFIGVFDKLEEKLTIRHRLQTEKAISAPPAYLPPDPKKRAEGGVFFTANHDGYVWAIAEKSGNILWKFATGRTIERSPTLIDEQLFVTTLDGGMYCLEASTGKLIWYVPEVVQFVTASKDRVYAVDKLSRIHVLDRTKGNRLDAFSVLGQILLTNTENDRIYMATPSGLVQCLHEIELAQPVEHGAARKPKQQRPAIIQQEAFPKTEEKEQPAQPPEEKQPVPKAKAKPKAEPEEKPEEKLEKKPEEKPAGPEAQPEEPAEEKPEANQEKPPAKEKEANNPFQF